MKRFRTVIRDKASQERVLIFAEEEKFSDCINTATHLVEKGIPENQVDVERFYMGVWKSVEETPPGSDLALEIEALEADTTEKGAKYK